MRNLNLEDKKTFYNISKLLFISYVVIFIWIVIFKCSYVDDLRKTHQHISSLTFYQRILNTSEIESLIYWIKIGDLTQRGFIEPLLNIVIFVPIGMYITFFQNKKSIFLVFLMSMAISLSVEVIQLLTMIGGFSYLDLITNIVGGIIGYYVYKIIYSERRVRILSIISISFLILAIPIAILAIFSTIANLDFYIDVALRRI